MIETLRSAPVVAVLRPPTLADHKYRRGVLGLQTGSATYPGAAVLGAGGALTAGVGMLRYYGPTSAARAVAAAHPEVVTVPGAVHSAVVGSGWDGNPVETARQFWEQPIPTVVDAGALNFPEDWGDSAGPRILTPHLGEAARLERQFLPRPQWQLAEVQSGPQLNTEALTAGAVALAGATNSIVVLKTGVTVIAAPGAEPRLFSPLSPWGGVAGSGDVLAGVIGALLSSQVARGSLIVSGNGLDLDTLLNIVVAAVCLHGAASSWAAGLERPGQLGHPISASQIAAQIPAVWQFALETDTLG